MKSPEEVVSWLIESMSHVYAYPHMYAITQSELNLNLEHLHHTWAYMIEREDEYRRSNPGLCKEESRAQRPDGFFDRIQDRTELDVVVQYWQEVDKRLGLEVPKFCLPEE